MATFVAVDHDPFNIGLAQNDLGAAAEANNQSLWSKLGQTWPARLAQTAWGAVTLPGDVYRGKTAITGEDGRTNPEVINRAADLAGLVTGGSYAAPAMKDASGMGIRAYHGSPHDFDRFDLSKIGTGEGAQAYGHGLYFAENPQAAQYYRDALSNPLNRPDHLAVDLLHDAKGNREAALAAANEMIANPLVYKPDVVAEAKKLIASGQELQKGQLGRMYEVNINAHPDEFLDWDKPLVQQPKIIQDLANTADLSHLKEGNRTRVMLEKFRSGTEQPEYLATGHTLHNALEDYGTKPNPDLSAYFRDQGIPGIKYLDQGSRAAGDGSRNYVLFNDKIIDIVRKYGLAGLSMLPPATAAYLSQRIVPVDHNPFEASQ